MSDEDEEKEEEGETKRERESEGERDNGQHWPNEIKCLWNNKYIVYMMYYVYI